LGINVQFYRPNYNYIGLDVGFSREFFSVRYVASYHRCYLHLQICDRQMLAKVFILVRFTLYVFCDRVLLSAG
jgi:hypothetical protein